MIPLLAAGGTKQTSLTGANHEALPQQTNDTVVAQVSWDVCSITESGQARKQAIKMLYLALFVGCP